MTLRITHFEPNPGSKHFTAVVGSEEPSPKLGGIRISGFERKLSSDSNLKSSPPHLAIHHPSKNSPMFHVYKKVLPVR